MKLKTLKEINEDYLQKKGYDLLCPVHFRILKKAAIKEIKAIQNNEAQVEGGLFSWQKNKKRKLTMDEKAVMISFIMWKNNITKEDLK